MSIRTDDTGVTLVELMISILLSAIVGGITTMAIVQSFHRQSEVDARARAVQTVRQALERTMRELRGADPLLAIGNDHLAVQETAANGDVRVLSYSVIATGSDKSLVLDEVDTPFGGASVPLPRRTIVQHLVNGSSVFSVLMPASCSTAGCAELVQMQLVVDPVRASGSSVCTSSGPTCLIDVSDQADIRNNT